MCQKTTLYQNAQIRQDMKARSVWSIKRSYLNELKTKLEIKFSEKEKKIISLENSCNEI